MASIRVSCSLLILLILQLHAHVSNSKEISPQATKGGGDLQSVTTSTISTNEKNVGNGMRNRKMLKGEKKDVDAESTEELVRGEERNDQDELKTASLTADYSDPLHHPPRHN